MTKSAKNSPSGEKGLPKKKVATRAHRKNRPLKKGATGKKIKDDTLFFGLKKGSP